eukprot:246365-Lingulodinium_polyedra.AAC.1
MQEEEIANIAAKRHCKVPERFASCLSTSKLDDIDGIVDAETLSNIRSACRTKDKEHAKSLITKATAKSAARAQAAQPVAEQDAGAGASSSSSGARPSRPTPKAAPAKHQHKPRALELPPGESWCSADIRPLLPPVAGCTILKDDVLHMRWKVKYPRPEPPYSTSRVWNAVTSERDSVLYCLKWAWEAHAQVTQEPCPFVWP